MSKKKSKPIKKKSSFDSDVDFLVAHAIMYSDKWNEQLEYIDKSKFSRQVKNMAEKKLDRDKN